MKIKEFIGFVSALVLCGFVALAVGLGLSGCDNVPAVAHTKAAEQPGVTSTMIDIHGQDYDVLDCDQKSSSSVGLAPDGNGGVFLSISCYSTNVTRSARIRLIHIKSANASTQETAR